MKEIKEKVGNEVMMYHRYREGWLEVISGCMFAGKTEELIRRVKVLEFAKKKVLVFKPAIDTRYGDTRVVSHAGSSLEGIVVAESQEILEYITDEVDTVAVDEVQFFDEGIVEVCEYLAGQGKRVMVAGLDMDFRGEPFGVMPRLITEAEFVTKLTAVCSGCGAPGTRTQRFVNGEPANWSDPLILVGASESYEARCRHCHTVVDKPSKLK